MKQKLCSYSTDNGEREYVVLMALTTDANAFAEDDTHLTGVVEVPFTGVMRIDTKYVRD